MREGISHRYTMMTLLGLDRFEKAGQTSPVPISPILDRLIADTGWIDCVGDLGLLLWTCAILAPSVWRRSPIRRGSAMHSRVIKMRAKAGPWSSPGS